MLRLFTLLSPMLGGCSGLGAELADGVGSGARVLDPGCAGTLFGSIQDAIDAAVDFDIVEVCSGAYAERLTVAGKILTLRSVGGSYATTIDAEGLGTALAIEGGAEVIVQGFTFLGGVSADTGGNVSCEASDLDLVDSVLEYGSAGKGGGLASSDCAGSVTGTTFLGNSAWRGGGAWVVGDALRFEGNTLIGNYATSAGGGLYLGGDSAVSDNTFDGNSSGAWGGGAYVDDGWGEVSGNLVTGNVSVDDGAGIYIYGGAPLVVGNSFVGNDSDDEGGGLRLKLSTGTVRDNAFVTNHADYRGGAIKVSHAAVSMTGNTFEGNSTWVTGGAILLFESASTLSDNTFADNTAVNGGAIAIIEGWGPVLIEDCRFIDNRATSKGGQIYVELVGFRTTLRRLDLRAGSADFGGGVYALGSDLALENTLLRENVASSSGGGLYLDATTGAVTNGVAWRCAGPDGSAITVANGANFAVVNSVFRQNATGAAISVSSGVPPDVTYSDFSGNTADFAGMPSALGAGGNLTSRPGFVRPGAGNFALRSRSSLVDAGDPAIVDLDGSRSDIGIFGGPEAD